MEQSLHIDKKTIGKKTKIDETIYKLTQEVNNKMEEYYQLKTEYETKEKKYKSEGKQPKCIFCKRPGGTIFKTEVKQGNRILLAYCNVKIDPCKSKIDIHTGKIELFSNKMREYENNIKELKKNVILYKNDLLFGYISSKKIVEKFNAIKEEIDKYTIDYYFIKENYELYVDNIENYIELCELEKQSYSEIEEIRVELNKYKYATQDEIKESIINSVVSIYIDKLTELLNRILNKKYDNPEVICDTDENCYKLIEIPKKYKTIYNEFSLIPIKVEDDSIDITTSKKSKIERNPINKTLKTKKKHIPLEQVEFIPKGSKIMVETKPTTLKRKKTNEVKYEDVFGEDFDEVDVEATNIFGEEGDVEPTNIFGEDSDEEEGLTLKTKQEQEVKQLISQDYQEIALANAIPKIVEYDPNIVLFITSNAEINKIPAGKDKHDKVPKDKLSEFTELNEHKDWRRELSNYATSNFTLDSKTWKTVEQYFHASKFKKGHPKIYEKFSLDYKGEGIVPNKPKLIISNDISLAKHYGTDGIYKGEKVRPDEITIDEDFEIPRELSDEDDINRYRENYEMFLAQKAKFTQNESMKKILLDTKNATLIDSDRKILYILMYVRSLIQTDML
jgi:predicted NAD-dependent protein-ADP-ribosyltransferase YbiA (DUF1768 family)